MKNNRFAGKKRPRRHILTPTNKKKSTTMVSACVCTHSHKNSKAGSSQPPITHTGTPTHPHTHIHTHAHTGTHTHAYAHACHLIMVTSPDSPHSPNQKPALVFGGPSAAAASPRPLWSAAGTTPTSTSSSTSSSSSHHSGGGKMLLTNLGNLLPLKLGIIGGNGSRNNKQTKTPMQKQWSTQNHSNLQAGTSSRFFDK